MHSLHILPCAPQDQGSPLDLRLCLPPTGWSAQQPQREPAADWGHPVWFGTEWMQHTARGAGARVVWLQPGAALRKLKLRLGGWATC